MKLTFKYSGRTEENRVNSGYNQVGNKELIYGLHVAISMEIHQS